MFEGRSRASSQANNMCARPAWQPHAHLELNCCGCAPRLHTAMLCTLGHASLTHVPVRAGRYIFPGASPPRLAGTRPGFPLRRCARGR
jgi:hypothetical protein